MTRPLRIEYPGAWYHVMNRGRRREEIFFSRKDYLLFLDTLREAVNEWRLQVAAYCLLPNHYHLLVQTPEGNLSRCMRHVNGVYTQRFNRLHETEGQLFRGRYKAIIVEQDNYLLELLRYVHLNPVRANIVKTPEEYQWSSHNGYLSNGKIWKWLFKDQLQSMLAETPFRAIKAYRTFVSQPESQELLDFFSPQNTPSILGAEIFKTWIKENFKHLCFKKEIPESHILAPDPDHIKKLVCNFYKVPGSALIASKRGETNIQRDVAIYLLRHHTNKTLAEIGKYFEITNYSTVSTIVEKIKFQIKTDRKLSKQTKQLEKKLSKSQRQT